MSVKKGRDRDLKEALLNEIDETIQENRNM